MRTTSKRRWRRTIKKHRMMIHRQRTLHHRLLSGPSSSDTEITAHDFTDYAKTIERDAIAEFNKVHVNLNRGVDSHTVRKVEKKRAKTHQREQKRRQWER